jgi:hypothetical protein
MEMAGAAAEDSLMTAFLDQFDLVVAAVLALAALLLALGSGETRRGLRLVGAALLLSGSLALLAAFAVPALLPLRSAVIHPDGSTDDPRVLSALVAAFAALAALATSWRALRINAVSAVGAVLPGLVAAGLFGSLAYFERLRAPMALAAVVLGSFAMGTALAFALRPAATKRPFGLLLQAFGVGVLAVAGVLSVHGGRAVGFTVTEDVPADTLCLNVSLIRVESPQPSRRIMTVELRGAKDSLRVRPRLEGEEGQVWRSVADGALLSGPIALPITLREKHAHAHEIQWLAKSDSLRAGDATLRFTGFRIEHTDSIRMYADLEVTTAAGTEKVSPGVLATQKGEMPFAANAKGFGPIAVARFDPDNHRVGLVLPVAPSAKHELLLDLRLRPGLPFAWAGAALALVGFLLGLVSTGETRRRA